LIDYYLEILFGSICKNMSLFGDGDGFGFLHNHRGEEETDSSSSSSEEEGEVEEDEQPCTHFGIINSFEEPQSPAIAALDSPTNLLPVKALKLKANWPRPTNCFQRLNEL
jgi:hypothetical protein